MHALGSPSYALAGTATPSTTTLPFHITGLGVCVCLGIVVLVVFLWRATRKHNITIHNHHPAPQIAPTGGGQRRGGKGKLLLPVFAVVAAIICFAELGSHHAPATATATAPAPAKTAPAPAPAHSAPVAAPKVITQYVNAHHLLSGPQTIILVGIILLFMLCGTAMIINFLRNQRG